MGLLVRFRADERALLPRGMRGEYLKCAILMHDNKGR